MAKTKVPPDILKRLQSVTAKRPRTVINHILRYGFVSTEDLKTLYGYDHPPRAARDVKELGIPLETFKVVGSQGRKIAAYRFGKWEDFRSGFSLGRRVFSKVFKEGMIEKYTCRCCICGSTLLARYLQIDHRVPYEVAGDIQRAEQQYEDYMLLCSSCNRAKSWSCEHCENWTDSRNSSICLRCYWAWPESYDHVAMLEIRRIDIEWQGEDVKVFDLLKKRAEEENINLPEYVKKRLKTIILH